MDTVPVLVAMVFLLASIPVAWAAVHAYRLYGGVRQITCPETMEAAVVKIRATRTIATRLAGGKAVRIRSCSRWPERQGCDEACVAQVMGTPGGCRIRALPGSGVPRAEVRLSARQVATTRTRLR